VQLNIVFVFHFCSPSVNDIASVPIWLGKQGNTVLVISSQFNNSLKGAVTAPRCEEIGGTRFYRPFQRAKDLRRWFVQHRREIREEVAEFRPDVIIQFGEFNFRLPMALAEEFDIPLVLFVEYLRLTKFALPFRGRRLIRIASPSIDRRMARIFRKWLVQRSSAVMFSYYGDCPLIPDIERHCSIVRYVPWCTEAVESAGEEKRDRKTGIYIGSLERFKNAAELVDAIPIIFEQSDTERFVVIGPGEYASDIRRLVEHYGSRLLYIESVSRPEAMRWLRSVGYGYTPVADCGLGFIGDCWGTGTPLIATHELDGFLHREVDTLIADGVYDLPRTINSVVNSDHLFERMQRGGRDRYISNFSARAVGGEYLKVLRQVVESFRKAK
jgi:glycosyltransferase involved in cell wall biosynthesis